MLASRRTIPISVLQHSTSSLSCRTIKASSKPYTSHFFSTTSFHSQTPIRPSLTVLQPAEDPQPQPERPTEAPRMPATRENIYTIPNALTVSRILACPVLGYAIIQGDFVLATSLLAYAGISDWVCFTA